MGRSEDAVLLRKASEVVHVLGGLLGDDVDDVIDGDDTEHTTVYVGDRHGQQVVAGHDLGDFFLVGIGFDADRVGNHHVADHASRRGRDQAADRNDAAQGTHLIDHVQVEDRLVVVGPGAQRFDGLLGRHLRVEGDEVGHHDPAGAGLGVELGLLELRARLLREQVDDRLAPFFRDPLDQLEQVVDLQAVEHPGQPLVVDRLEDFGQHLGRQLA